ncbi:MAG: right-handed parallel beta-helix repeat-containing protein [Clostridia bacterium]|nr:right-handed parallel beta-helix repeat-containing protein [Clostridia bacterium]
MRKNIVKAACLILCAALMLPLAAGCAQSYGTLPLKNMKSIISFGADNSGKSDISAALSSAAAACGKLGTVLYFPVGRYKIEATAEIPREISVIMAENAVFDISENAELKIKSLVFEAPESKIFDGAGKAHSFSPYVSVKAEWFGAVKNDGADDSAAIQKALFASNGNLYLESGVYDIYSPVNVDASAMDLSGSALSVRGKDKTVIKIHGGITAFENRVEANGANGYYFENLSFEGDGTGEALYLMKQVYLSNCTFKNLSRGLFANKAGMSSILYNSAENVSGNVFEIGDDTMFIYFSGNYAEKCGTLIRVVGGGVRTTGIQISNCQTKDMTDYDIWLSASGGDTNYINGCRFEGGSGKAFVYMETIQFPHITETEMIGSNNGKNGVEVSDCTHAIYFNKNVITGTKDAISVKGSNWTAISENLLYSNEKDIAIYSNIGVSVRENYLCSDIPIAAYGVNRGVTVTENFCKAPFEPSKNFSTDEFAVFDKNEEAGDLPSHSDVIGEGKKATTELIYKQDIVINLPTKNEKTVLLSELLENNTVSEAFKAAVSRLKSGGMIIVEAGSYLLEEDITLPENITLAMLSGALLEIKEGKTLTLLSSDVSYLAPTKIFEGRVSLKNADYVLSEWFGAEVGSGRDCAAAISLAISSGAKTLRLFEGKYLFTKSVSVDGGTSISIVGEGHNKTFLKCINKINYFALNGAADNDSFSLLALSADGNSKNSTLVAASSASSASVRISDVFANYFATVADISSLFGGVELSDLYVTNSKRPYIFKATDNVTGLRSLTLSVSEYTMDIDGKKSDGSRAKNYNFLNFCSVENQKNLSVKNVEEFFYSASGYDFAIGGFEATLYFENVKNGMFEGSYVTSANTYGALLKNCEDFKLCANVMTEHINSVKTEGGSNIEIVDNWFFRCKKTAINVVDGKNVSVKGNLFPYTAGIGELLFYGKNSEIIFAANVYHDNGTNVSSSFAPLESYANYSAAGVISAPKAPQKLPFEDFEALNYAEFGDINRPTEAAAAYGNNGALCLEAFSGGWFSNVGVVSKEKTAVNGLSAKITLICDASLETNKSRNFTLELSKDAPTAMSSDAQEWYGKTDSKDALSISFFFTETGVSMQARAKGELGSAVILKRPTAISKGDQMPTVIDIELSFSVNGNDLALTANGARIIIKNGAALLPDSAYLTFFVQSYGSASLTANITEINNEAVK